MRRVLLLLVSSLVLSLASGVSADGRALESRVKGFELELGARAGALSLASADVRPGNPAASTTIAYGSPLASRGAATAGKLSNGATRVWYKARLAEIPGRLNQSLPLRERAMQAFEMRNAVKLQARELMADRAAAAALPAPRTLSDVVRRAYQSGARGDDVWRYVLRGSGKSNAGVDAALGL